MPTDVHVRFCPVCGAEVEPMYEFVGPSNAESTVECPEHGEIMVEYHERD